MIWNLFSIDISLTLAEFLMKYEVIVSSSFYIIIFDDISSKMFYDEQFLFALLTTLNFLT